jgi:predicted lipoprotein with Yx(FWY)xxD motif
VDGQGRTVYRFAADTKDHSNCTGSCLQYWPAVTSSDDMPTAASSITAGLGVITRSDGTKQLTVNGWPVYTYAGDNSPGGTSGQGSNEFGGLWWVASTSGAEIMSTAGTANSTPSPSKSSSTGSRY